MIIAICKAPLLPPSGDRSSEFGKVASETGSYDGLHSAISLRTLVQVSCCGLSSKWRIIKIMQSLTAGNVDFIILQQWSVCGATPEFVRNLQDRITTIKQCLGVANHLLFLALSFMCAVPSAV